MDDAQLANSFRADVTRALRESHPDAEIVPGEHGIKQMSNDVAEVLFLVLDGNGNPHHKLAWICRSSRKVSVMDGWPL